MRGYLFNEITCGAPRENHLAQRTGGEAGQCGIDGQRPLMEIRQIPAGQNGRLVRGRRHTQGGHPILHFIQRLPAACQIDSEDTSSTGMNDLGPGNEKVAPREFCPTARRLCRCGKALAAEEAHSLVRTMEQRQQIPKPPAAEFSDRERLRGPRSRSPKKFGVDRSGIEPQGGKGPQILKVPLEAANAGKGNSRSAHKPTQVGAGSRAEIRAVMKNHRSWNTPKDRRGMR